MTPLTGPSVVRELVEQQLRRLYGAAEVDQQGDFFVRRGEVTAWLRILALQPDLTGVVVFAIVSGPLERVDDACRFLAAESLELPIGHFELHSEGRAVTVSHTLLGEFLSGEELRAAVDAVISTADTYGPRVREEFGAVLPSAAAATAPTPPSAASLSPQQSEELQRLLTAIVAQAPEPERLQRRSWPAWRRVVLLLLAVWVGFTLVAFAADPSWVAVVPVVFVVVASWAVLRWMARGSSRQGTSSRGRP